MKESNCLNQISKDIDKEISSSAANTAKQTVDRVNARVKGIQLKCGGDAIGRYSDVIPIAS